MDHFCYLCFVFVVQSSLLNAALWSPAGKGLPLSSLVCGVLLCFVTFPCGVLGRVWYFIVSIPDIYLFSYFAYLNLEGLCTFQLMQ